MPRLARLRYLFVPLVLVALCGALPSSAIAQQTGHPASGARIRVRLDGPDFPWQQGTLARANSDSLWYLSAGVGDTLVVERSNISRLQAFDGRASRAEQGALFGLGAGAAVGVGYGLTNMGQGSGSSYTVGALFLSVGVFGASGLLVGALVGALVRKDKWVDVPRLGLSIQGSNDSVRLSIGIGPPPQEGSR